MSRAIITGFPFPRQGTVAEFQPATEVRPTFAEAGIDKKLSSPFCPQKFWGFCNAEYVPGHNSGHLRSKTLARML